MLFRVDHYKNQPQALHLRLSLDYDLDIISGISRHASFAIE